MEEIQGNNEEPQVINPVAERPTGLMICLILSFISSLFGLLSNFGLYFVSSQISGMSRDDIEEQMEKTIAAFGLGGMTEQIGETVDVIMATGPTLGLIGIGVSVITLFAVMLMFRYRKAGFHLYTAARLVETFLPALVAGSMFFSAFTLFTSALFIYFYSRFLKLMH